MPPDARSALGRPTKSPRSLIPLRQGAVTILTDSFCSATYSAKTALVCAAGCLLRLTAVPCKCLGSRAAAPPSKSNERRSF